MQWKKLQQLKEKYSISTIVDKNNVALIPLHSESNNSSGSATTESSEPHFFSIKIPVKFFYLNKQKDKNGNEFYFKPLSKKDKTILAWFSYIKSFTKSDRIKFDTYKSVAEQFNCSKSQVYKILHNLQKRGLVKIIIQPSGIYHLWLCSWQKCIELFFGTAPHREKIKFVKLQVQINANKQVTSDILKQIYKTEIDFCIKAQEYQIRKKIIEYGSKEKYLGEKSIKKIVRSKADSSKRVANLCNAFDKLNSIKPKYLRKKYAITENEFAEYCSNLYYATILNQIHLLSLEKDNFCIMLNSRNIASKLNLSHTRANQLLNDFNFEISAIKLSKSDKSSVRYKKAYRFGNFYQFSKNYYYARVQSI